MVQLSTACFHCGLPSPSGDPYRVEIDGVSQAMCCPGCQAVAQAIVAQGLTDFYRYRSATPNTAQPLIPSQLRQMQLYDREELQASFVRRQDGQVREAALLLEGIVCAACVWLNEHHIGRLPGVAEFRVNLSTHRAILQWDNAQIQLSEILRAIADIGYIAHPFDPTRQAVLQKKESSASLRRLAVAGIFAMQVMMLAVALYAGEFYGMDAQMRQFLRWVSMLLALPVVVYSARIFFLAAWRDVRRWHLGMDVPVALAIAGAFGASAWATISAQGTVYFDSVTMFTFFLLAGRFLEMNARHRAGQVAESLVRLLPVTATCISANQEVCVPVTELQLDDVVQIRPGETVPADGVVIQGLSSVDESMLSGESLPVPKRAEDRLIGGSINLESPLQMRIEKLGQDTVVASISRLLERAQSEKPAIAVVADRVAAWFVTALLGVAALVFWYWFSSGVMTAFWITIAVLVVTCPCALSLATPVALTVATGVLTKSGLLITKGHALETLARVTHVVFDKTGTLTEGHLELERVLAAPGYAESKLLQIAAALERGSEHPLARALKTHACAESVVRQQRNIPGSGVEGEVDGVGYRLGTQAFVTEFSAASQFEGKATPNAGTVRIWLADKHKLLAEFWFTDQLRPQASRIVEQLMGLAMVPVLLSGDQMDTTQSIAKQLGIQQAHGAMQPGGRWHKRCAGVGWCRCFLGDGFRNRACASKC